MFILSYINLIACVILATFNDCNLALPLSARYGKVNPTYWREGALGGGGYYARSCLLLLFFLSAPDAFPDEHINHSQKAPHEDG